MTAPIRIEPTQVSAGDRIARNIDAMRHQGASDADIEAYLTQHEGLKPAAPPPRPSLSSRVADNLEQMVFHPIETVKGMAKGAVNDLSILGSALNAGMGQPNDLTPERAKEVPQAAARTLATAAFPEMTGAGTAVASRVLPRVLPRVVARGVGVGAAGAAAGAASNLDDPAAGAVTGFVAAPALAATGKVLNAALSKTGSGVVNVVGRPMESRPLVRAGPFELGSIEGVTDRAARLNREALSPAGPVDLPSSQKPLTPADVTGVRGQRLARGLKVSSPAAESVFRESLEPRADQAIERVIDHAKGLTGIKRADTYTTHEQLKANTLAQGDEAYTKAYGPAGDGPNVNIKDIIGTPAGAQGWARAQKMMANDGYQPSTGGPPLGFSDDQWALLKSAAKSRGIPLPEEGDVTLRQAHYLKLALDDLKQPGLDRGAGEGGLGYNEGRSIHGVQKRLLAKMDAASPEYAQARAQFADNKSLENASTLGQSHWTRDPVESAAFLKEMTPSEQRIYRDQAFDQWAIRTENGPENVAKGQAKSLNQKRLRLLFPDDASFQQFKTGLAEEAQMHATRQGVLSGSTTADKLADLAEMAGVTLPDVFKAMRGNPLPLVAKGTRALMTNRLRANADALARARAELLMAGADGQAGARNLALDKMQLTNSPLMSAISGVEPFNPFQTGGRKASPPSNAAQSIRAQVDALNKKETVRAHKESPFLRRP